MRNPVQTKLTKLESQSRLLANGLEQIGNGIGVTQNTAAKVRAELAILVAAILAHKQGVHERGNRVKVKNSLRTTARTFLTLFRDSLKPEFGTSYNANWDRIGLVGSLMIPSTIEELLPLLGAAAAFLTDNPDYEIALKNITAARAAALQKELEDAVAAINAQETVVGNLLKAQNEAARVLRTRIRGAIGEIAQLISPLAAEWLTCGLNKPGAQAIADVPTNVIAVLIGPNAVAVKWNAAPRAEYYRVWKKVNGVDEELIAIGSPADLDFTIEGLPANATVEIAISAVNNDGESAKTEVVTIVTA